MTRTREHEFELARTYSNDVRVVDGYVYRVMVNGVREYYLCEIYDREFEYLMFSHVVYSMKDAQEYMHTQGLRMMHLTKAEG